MNKSLVENRNRFEIPAKFLGLTIIWQDIETIQSAISQYIGGKDKTEFLKYSIMRSDLDLSRMRFGNPLYNATKTEICVYKPSCSPYWCVWIANILDGCNSILRNLSSLNKWAAFSMRSSDLDEREWIQELSFIHGPKLIRCVRAMMDGRPEFFSEGSPLFCEDIELYSRKSIRDRLTREVIASYLVKLGFPVYLSEFWASDEDAVYLSKLIR